MLTVHSISVMNPHFLFVLVCMVLLTTSSYKISRFKAHVSRYALFSSPPKLDYNEDLYSVLEVPSSVNSKELKQAYYRIVFKYHPDNKIGHNEKELCNQQMMVINAAYKVLRYADSRAKYDRKRHMSGTTSNIPTAGSTYTGKTVSSASEIQNDAFAVKETAPVESLMDIIAELVRDLAVNKGTTVWQDAMEILEHMDTEALISSGTRYGSEETSATPSLQEGTINDLQMALHVEQALLLVLLEMRQHSNAAPVADQILDCERNIKRLQLSIDQCKVEAQRKTGLDPSKTCSSKAHSSYPQSALQAMRNRTSMVDSELQKLKNALKMRNNMEKDSP